MTDDAPELVPPTEGDGFVDEQGDKFVFEHDADGVYAGWHKEASA